MPPYKIPNQLVLGIDGQTFSSKSSKLHIAVCQSWTNHQWYMSNPCNLRVIVVLVSYVVSSCAITIYSSCHSSGRASLTKVPYYLISAKTIFVSFFFELVSVESCFIDYLPYFSIRRIKQMTPVLFPCPVLSPHTAYLMLPL